MEWPENHKPKTSWLQKPQLRNITEMSQDDDDQFLCSPLKRLLNSKTTLEWISSSHTWRSARNPHFAAGSHCQNLVFCTAGTQALCLFHMMMVSMGDLPQIPLTRLSLLPFCSWPALRASVSLNCSSFPTHLTRPISILFSLPMVLPLLMANRRGKSGNSDRFSWAPESLRMVTAAMKLKDVCSLERNLWKT